MSVYFVYRSHYEGPSGKHVRVLDADSVLGWFRAAWERAKGAEDAAEWVKAEIGTDVYGFSSIFEAAREHSLPAPTSDRDLKSYLEEHLYVEGEIRYRPHALQVLTDDDEIELAYYVFDDHFLIEHPGWAAYLLHEGCKLPPTSGDNPHRPGIPVRPVQPRGAGAGETYLAFLAAYDSGSLSDLDEFGGPCRIKGVRVPQLTEYLYATAPDETWPFELKLLRSQIDPDDPAEVRLEAALGRVARLPVLRISETDYGARLGQGTIEQARTQVEEIVQALGGILDHDASKSLVGTSDHLAQLCLHVGNWFGKDLYHQWIIFDDQWAGEHRDLAEGILRYATRWDVLTI
jgi:hypothetical protein